MPTARELALACLEQKKSTVPFPQILEQAYPKLAPAANSSADLAKEKAFLMALCYGVLRYAGLLKQLFLPYCTKKPDSVFEHCLCLALYELLFLHKEEYSCVNEYVTVLKKAKNQQKANALNAILRAMTANKDVLHQELQKMREIIDTKIPANQIPGKKALRKLHSLADLPELFTQELDPAFIQLITEESFQTPLPSYRINNGRTAAADSGNPHIPPFAVPDEAITVSPTVIADSNTARYADTLKLGLLSRQGVCSALLTEKIADFLHAESCRPDSFWDMCCGRGGKSLGLLEKNIPITMATEPNQARLTEFADQLLRLSLPYTLDFGPNKKNSPIETTTLKDSVPKQSIKAYADYAQNITVPQKFSCILLDSPCSTSGTIARNPEVKYRITPQSLAEIIRTQQELLALAYANLKENGILFYCTCSVFTRENKGQIKTLLQNCPSMQLIREEYLTASRLNPQLAGHDILYFAILRKTA